MKKTFALLLCLAGASLASCGSSWHGSYLEYLNGECGYHLELTGSDKALGNRGGSYTSSLKNESVPNGPSVCTFRVYATIQTEDLHTYYGFNCYSVWDVTESYTSSPTHYTEISYPSITIDHEQITSTVTTFGENGEILEWTPQITHRLVEFSDELALELEKKATTVFNTAIKQMAKYFKSHGATWII